MRRDDVADKRDFPAYTYYVYYAYAHMHAGRGQPSLPSLAPNQSVKMAYRGRSMRSHWKPRRLGRVSFGERPPPLPPKQLLYVAAILSAAAVALSAVRLVYVVVAGPPGEHARLDG